MLRDTEEKQSAKAELQGFAGQESYFWSNKYVVSNLKKRKMDRNRHYEL